METLEFQSRGSDSNLLTIKFNKGPNGEVQKKYIYPKIWLHTKCLFVAGQRTRVFDIVPA